ncbi:MAG: insulinase family protein [Patescibacteria group bacterium]|nr:insulinase family protein [Patescibacteria group bacterium]
MSYTLSTLSNKLRVITVPMEGVTSATVQVLVGAGSRYEEAPKAGLSHFLEHMIFKGTKKRPSALEISSLVDSVGGENNAFTGKDQTGFYIKIQKKNLALAFDILSDTLINSLYLPEEINKERGTIIEEINLYEDTPMYKIDNVFFELVFNHNPLGWPISGDKETVSRITHEDFVNYARRFYQGKDMVLVVAGKVDQKEVEDLAKKYFLNFSEGEKEKFLSFKEDQKEPRLKIEYKKTDQAHLYLGFPAFSVFDPDKPALNVLNAIMGGGMSSRLFTEVREKRGLAYYVGAAADLFADSGMTAARAGVNLAKIEGAISVIIKEFERIKEKKVGEEELQKAKEFIKGRVSLSLESSNAQAEWYGERELIQGKIETPEETFAKVDQVTAADIQRVANRLFAKDKRNLAIVGPFEDEKKFKKLLSS